MEKENIYIILLISVILLGTGFVILYPQGDQITILRPDQIEQIELNTNKGLTEIRNDIGLLKTDDIFSELVSNKVIGFTGESIFIINSPARIEDVRKYLLFDFMKVVGNDVKTYEVYVQKNVSYNVSVPDKLQCKEIYNETAKRNTEQCEKTYKNVTKHKLVWRKNGILERGENVVKFIGRWKPKIWKQSIDWIPTLEFKKEETGLVTDISYRQEKWAWWNSSYNQQYPHIANGSGWDGIGYFGANITGWYGTIGQNASTYNDSSGSTGRAVGNDTNELCWFDTRTEKANCPIPPNDLALYYPLDLGSGNVWETIKGKNATNYGATRSQTGQIYNGFDFESSEKDGVNVTGIDTFHGSQHLTMGFWYKPETLHSQALYLYDSSNSEGTRLGFVSDTTGTAEYVVFGDGDAGRYGTYNARDEMSTGNWYHFVFVFNGSATGDANKIKIFVNATQKSIGFSKSVTLTTISNSFNTLGIGEAVTLNVKFSDGVIDDVRVYNQSFSDTKITNWYKSTRSNRPYLGTKETLNNISLTLESPSNAIITSNISIDYICNAYTGEVNIENVSLIFNGSVAETNSSGINNTNYTFNKNFTVEDVFNWSCTAYDEANNSFSTNNRSIEFRTYPNMTDVTDFNWAFGSTIGKDFDATDFSGIDTWTVNETTNFSINSTGYLISNSILESRNYTINISVNDTVGWTTSKVITIQIIPDTQTPRWTVIPANASTIYGTWAGVDFDATDDVAIKGYYVNNSYFEINAFGFLSEVGSYAPVGEYNLLVRVNDTSDNTNTTEYHLEINKSSALTGNIVTNDTWSVVYDTPLNISISETNTGDGDNTYTLYKNGTDVGQFDAGVFGVGTYLYLLNVTAGTNYTSNSSLDTQILNVTKFPTNLSLSVNPSGWIVGAGSVSTVTGTGCPSELTCVLQRDGVTVSNPDTQSFATVGNRTYIYSTTGNDNYTSDSVNNTLEVIENIHFDEMLGDDGNITFNGTINKTLWFEVLLDEFTTDGYLNMSSNNSANNSWIEVGIFGDGQEWNNTGSLTSEERTDNFADVIRDIIADGCNCTNCTIRAEYCQIPILFHADNGTLFYETDIHNHGIIENGNIFTEKVVEGEDREFVLNLSYDSTYYEVYTKKLVYNGTEYSSGTLTELYNHTYNLSKSIYIPEIESPLNYTFYWNITLSDKSTGTKYSTLSSTQTQRIENLFFGLCGSFDNDIAILNFTLLDEKDGSEINATAYPVDFLATFYVGQHSENLFLNYSIDNSSVNVNEFDICTNTSSNILFIDADISYTANTYVDRNYYMRNATLTNNTNEVNLYLRNSSDALEFFISVFENLDPLADAQVNIQKYFIGEGAYKTVEIDVTGDDGKISSYLEVDADYKFTITKGGEVKKITTKKAICESAPCEISIYITEDTAPITQPFTQSYAGNVEYNFSFNPNNHLLTFNFIDLAGTADYFRLKIYKQQYNETRQLLSDQTVYTTAGSLTYNTTGTKGEYLAKAFVSRSPELFIDDYHFSESDLASTLGLIGIFMSFLLFLTIIFGVGYSPVTLILAVPLAITALKLMEILNVSYAVISLVWVLTIIALMALWKQ